MKVNLESASPQMILQLVWILWPWKKDITDRIESSVRFVARRLSRRHAKDKEGRHVLETLVLT